MSAPNKNSGESVSPNDTSDEEGGDGQIEHTAIPQVPPSPPQQDQSNGSTNNARTWEKWAAIFIAAGTVGLLVVNICLMRSTEKSADAAQSAASTATQSLMLAKQQFSDDQRAWVGVENAIVRDPPSNKVGLLNIVLKNTGKTPALHLHVFGVMQREKGTHLMDISDARRYPIKELGILMPNAESTIPSHIPYSTDPGIKLLQNGAYHMVSYGIVEYDDVAGRPHNTTLCIFIAPDFQNVGWCDKYNDAN